MVHIMDQNDNAPAFQSSAYMLKVPENTRLTVVHTVVAMDLDSGSNGRITYSIVGKSFFMSSNLSYSNIIVYQKYNLAERKNLFQTHRW